MKQLLRLCLEIVAINSTNPHGTLELAAFLAAKFRTLKFKTRLQRGRLAGAPQANLIAWRGPARGRPLILNTHLDTVTTDSRAWTKTGGDPFHGKVLRGRLYGLGTADTKLAIACQWMALQSLKDEKWKRPVFITGTYGEEMGLVGVSRLIDSPYLTPGDVLNSEPTGLRLAVENKGFRIFRFRGKAKGPKSYSGTLYELAFEGKAAHSGTPKLGINACLQALRWYRTRSKSLSFYSMEGGLAPNIVAPFCRLQVLGDGREIRELKKFGGRILKERRVAHLRFFPGIAEFLKVFGKYLEIKLPREESQNLGLLKCHSGHFEAFLDHRFPARSKPEDLLKRHRVFLAQWQRKTGDRYSLKIEKDNPAFHHSGRGDLIREVASVLASIGRPVEKEIKPGCTEAGYFSGIGCDVLTLGPGLAYGNAHQPNEYVPVGDLADAVIFYKVFLSRFCR